ncbi:hypothetical protein ABTY59_31675 [Streptomyces sp. NPDC096079]|uniref:hypothetical protein n=1 Tax=Streptomyces sp. NPDC096079 TaxID=3155820 RepID=UPI003331ED91
MQFNRQTQMDLISEGKAAFQGGDPSDACPYDRYGDREQQVGYRYWTRGWGAARAESEAAAAQRAQPSAGQ